MWFNYETSLFLNGYFKKNGFQRNCSIFDNNFCFFEQSDLETIEELDVTGLNDISFLEFLPNLKRLHIISNDYSEVTLDGDYEYNVLFNNIEDFAVLERLPNLEELEIINDINVSKIDFTNLTKLKKLTLRNNPKLESLVGMDKLFNLKEVLMVGNPIKEFSNFGQYLINTVSVQKNILDVDSFLASVEKESQANLLYDYLLIGLISSSVAFSERSGFTKYNSINLKEMTSYYSSLLQKFKKDKVPLMFSSEKIEYLFKIGLSVPFAQKDIENRDDLYVKALNEYDGEVPEFIQKRMNYLHSGYTTYQRNSGNCEGIVNLLHTIATIIGLDSQVVYCHDKRSGRLGNNHALIRIKSDGEWLYYDPTYKRQHGYDYFAMDFETVSKYVDLCEFEKKIAGGKNKNDKHNRKNL